MSVIDVEGKAYCTKCGNNFLLEDGTPCDCRSNGHTVELPNTNVIDFIPPQYIGMYYDSGLVKNDKQFADYLNLLRQELVINKRFDRNIYIGANGGSSKQVFAYTILQELALQNIPVFPILDLKELTRYIKFYDEGRPIKTDYDFELMYNAPVLFMKVVGFQSNANLDALALTIDRRVRRGFGTIILSSMPWKLFIRFDEYNIIRSKVGEGTFNTIMIKEWFKQ